jgi:hypothetical protein
LWFNVKQSRMGRAFRVLRIKGLCKAEPRQPIILRMPSSEVFTVRKIQLLNILNLKISCSQ